MDHYNGTGKCLDKEDMINQNVKVSYTDKVSSHLVNKTITCNDQVVSKNDINDENGRNISEKNTYIYTDSKTTVHSNNNCEVIYKDTWTGNKHLTNNNILHAEITDRPHPNSCKKYTNSYTLSQYQVPIISTNEQKYRCNKCSKHFSTKSNLNRHCKTCVEATFDVDTRSSDIKIYRKTHIDDTVYHRESSREHYLPRLIFDKREHSVYGDHATDIGSTIYRIYECKKCGNMFSTKSNLNRHVKSCCIGAKDDNCVVATGSSINSKPAQKVHQCTICSKQCLTSYALLEHERVHSGVPFKCVYCGKSFSTKSNWRRHLVKTCMKMNEMGKWKSQITKESKFLDAELATMVNIGTAKEQKLESFLPFKEEAVDGNL